MSNLARLQGDSHRNRHLEVITGMAIEKGWAIPKDSPWLRDKRTAVQAAMPIYNGLGRRWIFN